MLAVLLLLLFSSFLPQTIAEDHEKDYQIAGLTENGLCYVYLDGYENDDFHMTPCKNWCKNEKDITDTYGCRNAGDYIKDPSLVHRDDDGHKFTMGVCFCDAPVLEFLVNVVIEGLAKLDNVLCAVMLSAFQSIAEIGTLLIPGVGEVSAGVRAAVQGAKTFSENGLEASSFFGDWIGPTCGVDDFSFDLSTVFGGLVGAPDSAGTSKGCFKKKGKCNKPKPKDDPKDNPKDKPDDDDRTTTKKDDTKTTSTTTAKTTSTKTTQTSEPTAACEKGKGGKGCDSDCSKVQYDLDENSPALKRRGTGFFGLEERELEKRASDKTINICGIEVETDDYPRAGKLGPSLKSGDDIIYAIDHPKDCTDFHFRKQTYDKFNKVYDKLPKGSKRRLETEHVLEAQLIGQFFKDISAKHGKKFPDPYNQKKKVYLCDYIEAFWSADDPKKPLPKIQGKNNGNAQSAAFWIADAFPTEKNYQDEFLLLPGYVNMMKMRAWGSRYKNIASSKTVAKNMKKSDFLDKNKKFSDSEFVKSFVTFKDAISAYKYHQEPIVEDIFVKESKRIAETLNDVEAALENLDFQKAKTKKKFTDDYKRKGLDDEWNDWIKSHADKSIAKIDKFFKDNKDKYVDARKRLDSERKKLGPKTKNRKFKEGRYGTLIGGLKKAEKAYDEMMKTPWKNPF